MGRRVIAGIAGLPVPLSTTTAVSLLFFSQSTMMSIKIACSNRNMVYGAPVRGSLGG
jgi:hypothetical protein